MPWLLVIHAISLPPGVYGGNQVARLFTNTLSGDPDPFCASVADLRVSAHFFIRRDGGLIQFVPIDRRAWHAGQSCWRGQTRCNDFSIGVELEGCDTDPFEDVQYGRLNGLIAQLCQHLPLREAVGHRDIAPGRKTDPGPCFDWQRVSDVLRHPGAGGGA